MKTIEEITGLLTSDKMLEDVAELLRDHVGEFSEIEKSYKEAVSLLRKCLSKEGNPNLDEYLSACQQDVIANMVYAGYLGYRANLENFHAPYTTGFVRMDFTDYIRDHLIGHFPANDKSDRIKDVFHKALPIEYEDALSAIDGYFIELDVSGPKLAHYAGYMISNAFLPWVEPGYRADYAQTYSYKTELYKYMGFLPLE